MKNMQVYRAIQSLLLAGVIIASVSVQPVRLAAGTTNTPTYILGVSNPLDPLIVDLSSLTSSLAILPSPSYLSTVSPNSLLFVDGGWLSNATSLNPTILSLLVATALQGTPTVTVRGPNPSLISQSISGLFRWHPQNTPLISEGVSVTSTLPNGDRTGAILQVIAGFDYAVQREFGWAQAQLPQASTLSASAPPPQTLGQSRFTTAPQISYSSPPFWSQRAILTVDTGNYYAPQGRIITTATVFSLENSGSTTYTWYNFFFNQTIMPGIMIYNSDWRTYTTNAAVQSTNTTSTWIVSHGPGTVISSGPTVVNYNIGVAAGALGASVNSTQSQSYPIKNTNVTDTSPPNSVSSVSWIHTVDARSGAGTLTLTVIPGWTFRLFQAAYLSYQGTFIVTFAELKGNTVYNTYSNTLMLISQ